MRMSRHMPLVGSLTVGLVALLAAGVVLAQTTGDGAAAALRGRPAYLQLPAVPLFFRETLHRSPGDNAEHPVMPSNLSDPNLSLQVLGLDAKELLLAGTPPGTPGSINYVMNLFTGLSSEPIAVLLRDRNNYVDLTGRAAIRWVIRTSGFHVVRPAIRLADGTLLVGDHADSSTTVFAEREFAIADIRWIRLDPKRVVTLGAYGPYGQAASWYPDPDLSRVDAVGWADLMPGSGHGAGGWVNVGPIEVYGKPVPRT